MSLRIRLARGGAKKKPFYRVVVAENTSPRDGKFIERLGFYNPMVTADHKDHFVVDVERTKYWLSVGAQPTERLSKIFSRTGIGPKHEVREQPKKSKPRKTAGE